MRTISSHRGLPIQVNAAAAAFVDSRVRIQTPVNRGSVSEVVDNGCDGGDAAKPIVKVTWNSLLRGRRTLPRGITLLNPGRIATADCAAPCDGSIHTDVDLVMLGCSAQDARISR